MVSTLTLDSICKITSLQLDLVKIDVEGAEIDVLNGAKSLALNLKPIFFVEIHSNPTLPMYNNALDVIKRCHSLNYTPYYLKEKTVLQDAAAIAHRGRCHLILIPGDKSFPESLKYIEQGAEVRF